MILSNGDVNVISDVFCSKSTECIHRGDCLVIHPVSDEGRTGTFYPQLSIVFYGKFIISCSHFKEFKKGVE